MIQKLGKTVHNLWVATGIATFLRQSRAYVLGELVNQLGFRRHIFDLPPGMTRDVLELLCLFWFAHLPVWQMPVKTKIANRWSVAIDDLNARINPSLPCCYRQRGWLALGRCSRTCRGRSAHVIIMIIL